MNQKFIYYIIFVLTFLLFNFVQEHARPNYSGDNTHYLLPWGTSELLTGYWPPFIALRFDS